MALLKAITDDKGITANYHKIESITYNNGVANVVIASYVSEKYREENIKNSERAKRHFEIGVELAEKCKVQPEKRTEKEEAEIQKLISESEAMGDVAYDVDLSVGKRFYTINLATNNKKAPIDVSFEHIYKKLKETDDFKDAKDI